MKIKRKISAALFVSAALLSFASAKSTVDGALLDTAQCVYKMTAEPQIGSVGGEWAIFGLSLGDYGIPKEYFEKYIQGAKKTVKAKNGILSERKNTEFSRVAIAFASVGEDPQNICGYNMLAPLEDFEKTVSQGINGAVFALIALDTARHNEPENRDELREKYISYILSRQSKSGGWAMSESAGDDADVTAMALQALCGYVSQPGVKAACDGAISFLQKTQCADGGFESGGSETCESCVQVITALSSFGISPLDARFVKNGNTPKDALLAFYVKGKGFKHIKADTEINRMSTEQALYGLAALKFAEEGKRGIYCRSFSAKRFEKMLANVFKKDFDKK